MEKIDLSRPEGTRHVKEAYLVTKAAIDIRIYLNKFQRYSTVLKYNSSGYYAKKIGLYRLTCMRN